MTHLALSWRTAYFPRGLFLKPEMFKTIRKIPTANRIGP
jgi:hypothetical protein